MGGSRHSHRAQGSGDHLDPASSAALIVVALRRGLPSEPDLALRLGAMISARDSESADQFYEGLACSTCSLRRRLKCERRQFFSPGGKIFVEKQEIERDWLD